MSTHVRSLYVKLSHISWSIPMDPKHGVIKGQHCNYIFCNFIECVGEYTTLPLPEIQKTCAILMVSLLYYQQLCRGVYSFCLSVCMFLHLFRSYYFGYKNFNGVYLSNHLPESIHICRIVTLED